MVMKEVALKYIALEISIDSGDWEQSEQVGRGGEKRRSGASGRQGSFASRHCICNDSGLSFPMAVRDAMRLCPSASSHHARQHAPTEGGSLWGNGSGGGAGVTAFELPAPKAHLVTFLIVALASFTRYGCAHDKGPRIHSRS